MRRALPQLGVDTMPNDAGRFHDRQSEDAGADGVRPDEPHPGGGRADHLAADGDAAGRAGTPLVWPASPTLKATAQ